MQRIEDLKRQKTRMYYINRKEEYTYNKSQSNALFLKFILLKNSTCFGQ